MKDDITSAPSLADSKEHTCSYRVDTRILNRPILLHEKAHRITLNLHRLLGASPYVRQSYRSPPYSIADDTLVIQNGLVINCIAGGPK